MPYEVKKNLQKLQTGFLFQPVKVVNPQLCHPLEGYRCSKVQIDTDQWPGSPASSSLGPTVYTMAPKVCCQTAAAGLSAPPDKLHAILLQSNLGVAVLEVDLDGTRSAAPGPMPKRRVSSPPHHTTPPASPLTHFSAARPRRRPAPLSPLASSRTAAGRRCRRCGRPGRRGAR